MTVNNKTILITGAGGGMGKETALLLMEKGANVVGCDRDISALEEMQKKDNFLAVQGDVLDEAVVSDFFKKAKDHFGSIDGLANILGIAQSATPIDEVSFDHYHKLMDINMSSIFLTCREAARYMKPQEAGKIVNIGSVATTRPRPGLQAYVASKGAVETFSKALALELAPHQINVNVLHPGPADTSMLGQFSGEGSNVAEDRKEIFEKSVPLGKLLQPKNIADTVAFLLSEEAEMITGSVLHVDGGRSI